jgi:hypothetical protein
MLCSLSTGASRLRRCHTDVDIRGNGRPARAGSVAPSIEAFGEKWPEHAVAVVDSSKVSQGISCKPYKTAMLTWTFSEAYLSAAGFLSRLASVVGASGVKRMLTVRVAR